LGVVAGEGGDGTGAGLGGYNVDVREIIRRVIERF
jgi:hypothetical protein